MYDTFEQVAFLLFVMELRKASFMNINLAAVSGSVTARFQLLSSAGVSTYIETVIDTSGKNGSTISTEANRSDIVGAKLIYASGTLLFSTDISAAPTSTTGITVAPPAAGAWVDFGQVG